MTTNTENATPPKSTICSKSNSSNSNVRAAASTVPKLPRASRAGVNAGGEKSREFIDLDDYLYTEFRKFILRAPGIWARDFFS